MLARVTRRCYDNSMMHVRVLAAFAASLALSGCGMIKPYSLDADIEATEAQLQGLNARVEQLEAQQGIATGVAAGSTATSMALSGSAIGGAAVPSVPVDSVPWYSSWFSRKAFGKLGRGIANTFTGWVEIPKRVYETSQESGVWKGISWGVVRGIGFGFVRTAAGLYEVVSFPVPAPADYQPVIRPEFVYSAEGGV